MKKYSLCGEKGCDECPDLIIKNNEIEIGEIDNLCTLKPAEFAKLVKIIKEKF